MHLHIVRRIARHIARASVVAAVTSAAVLTTWSPGTGPELAGAPASAATPRTFYVDPVRGRDTYAGTTQTRPLRTLSKASTLALAPGDRLRLRSGVSHVGGLTVSRSGTTTAPILVDRYGTGYLPLVDEYGCVQVTGNHVTVVGLHARGCTSGFRVRGDHVTLRAVEASANQAGVAIDAAASYAVVADSRLHDNTRMAPDTPGAFDDYGANGIVVSGDDATVTGNLIERHRAVSPDFGYDGSAIEVWGAIGTRVSRNVARDNLAFTELGHSRTSDTRYDYNAVVSTVPDGRFLITRGTSTFGPVTRTVAEHNTVRLTGAGALGYSCHPGCDRTILEIGSNVIQAPAAGYAEYPDGTLAAISLGHNVFEELVDDGYLGMVLAPTDVLGPAGFTAPLAGDLTLRIDAPGVDIGGPSWPLDLPRAEAPQDGDGDGRAAADAGAYERPAG